MTIFIYCPKCKSKLLKVGRYPHCEECDITYYRNSKPTAGILPIRDGKVLLAKRSINPFKGHYDVIGGFLREGEQPENTVKREVREETGSEVEIFELLGMYTDKYGESGDHVLNIQYVGRIMGNDIKPSDDVASLHWIPIGKTPKKYGFKQTKKALIDLKKWYIRNNGKFG